MRIFHLSDLHIGIKLYNRDLREEQEYLFAKIIEYVKKYQPDAILIAGDIYDKSVPSVEAVQTFNDFVQGLYEASDRAQIMMISGNHDSAGRLDYFSWLMARQRVHMVGMPPVKPDEYMKKVTLTDEYGEVDFYLLPFSKPSVIRNVFGEENDNVYSYNEALHKLFAREKIDVSKRNVLLSHQFYLPFGKSAEDIERMESEITTVGNVDVVWSDVLEPFDYAALGHIHKPMTVGDNRFRYSGTPFAYSVSEANQEKGILMADIGRKGEAVSITRLPLIPKHKVRIIEDTFDHVLKEASDDYVLIRLTDTEDLDVIDLQERILMKFPNLLEIQRNRVRGLELSDDLLEHTNSDPLELICEFIPDMDEDEMEIMKSVINEALEAEE